MSQAFSDQAIKQLHILGVIRDWTNALGDVTNPEDPATTGDWSKAKDMAPWSAYMVVDVLGVLLFGRSYNISLRPDNR